MRRHAPPPESWSAYPAGSELLPLGLLMIAGTLQFVVAVFFLLLGIAQPSVPHMHLNAVLTPLLFLLALVWASLRLLRLVTPETATGFSLAAFGLAARALAELGVWLGPPPGRAVWQGGVSPLLVDLVRHAGLIAYVTGIAFAAASSARAIGQSAAAPRRVRAGWGAWIAAGLCFAVVVFFVLALSPAVVRLQAK